MRLNAKELIADARVTAPTLPPAAAKLMSEMADRLDVQFVVLCESRDQVKQLAAEGAALKDVVKGVYPNLAIDVSTETVLASLRAEGVEMFAKTMHAETTEQDALDFAAQLRSQSAPSSEAEQPPASPAIEPIPVQRDQYGYWTHLVYNDFCDGREHISSDEFNAWLDANGLAWKVAYRDEEDIDPAVDGYDISKWQPEAPAGEGWFVGSIHDSEDGAVCIWLRQKSEPSQEAAAIARQFEQVKGGNRE